METLKALIKVVIIFALIVFGISLYKGWNDQRANMYVLRSAVKEISIFIAEKIKEERITKILIATGETMNGGSLGLSDVNSEINCLQLIYCYIQADMFENPKTNRGILHAKELLKEGGPDALKEALINIRADCIIQRSVDEVVAKKIGDEFLKLAAIMKEADGAAWQILNSSSWRFVPYCNLDQPEQINGWIEIFEYLSEEVSHPENCDDY